LLFSRDHVREKQRKLVGNGAITDGETDAKYARVDGPLLVILTRFIIAFGSAHIGILVILTLFIAMFGSVQGLLILTWRCITAGATFVKWTLAGKDGKLFLPFACCSKQFNNWMINCLP
jgi:hypothetical protein